MIKFLFSIVLLIALGAIVFSALETVGSESEYDLSGASAIQVQQINGQMTFELMRLVVALLAIMTLLEIGKFAGSALKDDVVQKE